MLIKSPKTAAPPLTIPRHLHQIWLGKTPLPPRWKAFSERLKELHPGWEYRLWTDDDLPALFRADVFGLPLHYNRCQNFGYQSDLVRLMILFQHGGIYLDTDCEPLRSMDGLADTCSALIGATFTPQPIREVLVENAVIGATPAHPFLVSAMQTLTHDLSRRSDDSLRPEAIDVVGTTGPGFLSAALMEYRARRESIGADVAVLPTRAFYPVVPGWGEIEGVQAAEDHPGSFLLHHWKGSWKGQAKAD